MKYESPITCHSKDMTNVKVFADRQTNRQTGQKLYAPDLSIRGIKITNWHGIFQLPSKNVDNCKIILNYRGNTADLK
jgi:hypothetical protein